MSIVRAVTRLYQNLLLQVIAKRVQTELLCHSDAEHLESSDFLQETHDVQLLHERGAGFGKQSLLTIEATAGNTLEEVAEDLITALHCPPGLIGVEFSRGLHLVTIWGRHRLLLATLLIVNEEPLDQEVLHVKKLAKDEEELKEDVDPLIESTNITDPVKDAVDVAVHPVKSKIKLERNLQVHIVGELVRPHELVLVAVHILVILRQRAKLIVGVLQAQIGQLYFVDLFLTLLCVDGDPDSAHLFRNLRIVLEVSRAEPHRVVGDEDELALQPLQDLLV